MDKQIERLINDLYKKIFKKVFNKERTSALMNGQRWDAEQALLSLQQSDQYDKFAKEFSLELAKKGLSRQKGIWRKYYQAAKSYHRIALPATYNEYELQILSNVIQHNFRMIKSIPERMMEVLNHKYTSTLMEEVAKGTLPRGSFQKQLEQHGWKQARVIARTETAKLQTAITENRATDLGSVAYRWIASNDRRTRPSHKKMNGVIVFWRPDNQKPLLDNMRGNAGEFPNCRCDPEPLFDVSDLSKSTYKVYDYRVDKIITMSKKDLLEAFEKGSL